MPEKSLAIFLIFELTHFLTLESQKFARKKNLINQKNLRFAEILYQLFPKKTDRSPVRFKC